MSRQIPVLTSRDFTMANGYLIAHRSQFNSGLPNTIGVFDSATGIGTNYFERAVNETHGDEVHSWVYKNASGMELIVHDN